MDPIMDHRSGQCYAGGMHWSFRNLCTCEKVWKTDLGRFDPVTGKWLPDAPVSVVSLAKADDCPIHFDWYFDIKVKILEELENGWVRTSFPDGKLWKLWGDQILDTPLFNDPRKLGV